MLTKTFHKKEKIPGNEYWWDLVIDLEARTLKVRYSWDTATGQSGEDFYSIDEFQAADPNHYRRLLEYLAEKLP
jgi:hypothetical protein